MLLVTIPSPLYLDIMVNLSDCHYLTNEQYAKFLKFIGENKQGLDEAYVSAQMAGISCNSFPDSSFNK